MAEREALQRQIEELQNRITEHKRVHGDAPSSSAQWFSSRHGLSRGRGHNPHFTHSYSHQTQPYPTSQWRKVYSLNNKTRASGQELPKPIVSKIQQVKTLGPDSNLAGISKVTVDGTSKDNTVCFSNVVGRDLPVQSNRVPAASGNRTALNPTRAKTKSGVQLCIELAKPNQHNVYKKEKEMDSTSKSTFDTTGSTTSTSFIPSSEETSAFSKKETSALPQMKTHLERSISTSRTLINAISDTANTGSDVRLQASAAAIVQATSPSHKRSRFTWVKSQGTETSQTKSEICQPSSAGSAPTVSPVVAKQTHGSNKKMHRRLSTGIPKTSKYSWVSSSCSATTVAKAASVRLSQKLLSPKASKLPGKTAKGGIEENKILTSTPLSTTKRAKVGGVAPTSQGCQASRYRWKAATASTSVVVSGSTPKSSQKGSVYRWTVQKEEKNSGPLSSRIHHSPSTPLTTGFKLRSRTKIIRRFSSSNSSAVERRPSISTVTVRSRYSLRRRTHNQVKTPISVRRGQSRALVALGRHKLRRISSSTAAPWIPRTGSVRSPASPRIIKTRFKIDTRRAHPQHLNSAFSYRVKRVQSARILLQSQLRTTPDRHWKGRGMRWINGALYRVSANKLSRTHTTSTPSNRSGKHYSAQDVYPCIAGKTSSTQHVASRVVQRSLAIIRQAQQKKQNSRQYCMYYNRFGKCNRGTACPYIHDPDKVAVCTRFLRGTCKQTDGTCPFSHKVSKEKMPVCSYFLKGICNNSSCPYSHVYVSRKAAVCQDFVRGYCPQGEKCKKKHTLVCPDFSSTGVCPNGSKCKLQHRQRAKRGQSSGPAKKARAREATKRPEPETAQAEEGTPSTGPAKLPSFISLSSSPETPESSESPSCPPVARPEVTGRKLHIKPRFLSQS